jgi:alpha-aminoadipate carrier protein LysW
VSSATRTVFDESEVLAIYFEITAPSRYNPVLIEIACRADSGTSSPQLPNRTLATRTEELMATCPECEAEIEVDEFDVDKGDQLSCPECGSNLEVTGISPIELDLATEDDDDDDDELEDDDDLDDDEDGEDEDDEEGEDWEE